MQYDAFHETKHFVRSANQLIWFSELFKTTHPFGVDNWMNVRMLHIILHLSQIACHFNWHTNSLMKSWIQQKWILVHFQLQCLDNIWVLCKEHQFSVPSKMYNAWITFHSQTGCSDGWLRNIECTVYSIIEKWIYITSIYRIMRPFAAILQRIYSMHCSHEHRKINCQPCYSACPNRMHLLSSDDIKLMKNDYNSFRRIAHNHNSHFNHTAFVCYEFNWNRHWSRKYF